MGHDHTFDLTDADGTRHSYGVTLHPGGEGYALSLELVRLGLPVLGKLAGLLEGLPEEGDTADLGLDGAAELAAKVLGSVDGPALTRRILAHTHRDGHPLASDVVFDQLARGNYAEVYQAVAQVVAYNRFFPVPTSFGAAATKLGAKG